MDSQSGMELIREKIRAALDSSPDKSRKTLAKLLNISATQVSSLLKPGGRHLRAVEVPVVERYLGIILLDYPDFTAGFAENPQIFGFPRPQRGAEKSESMASRQRLERPRAQGPAPEGTQLSLADLPPELAQHLAHIAGECAGRVWRLTTNNLQSVGYLSGDYVVVDCARMPRPKDVVLAMLRDGFELTVPIFRAYVPPYLMVANPGAMLQSPLLVDDDRVAVIGVITASVRIRDE
jgi:hypothetical protein